MIKLKTLISELEYPLSTGDDRWSYKGAEGWKGKVVWMSPDKFLRLAAPLPDILKNEESLKNIEHRILNGLPIDYLTLEVDMTNKKVTSHEGRHRAIVCKKLGIEKVPVLIYTGNVFPRVPKWTPTDHDIVDKADFKPEKS